MKTTVQEHLQQLLREHGPETQKEAENALDLYLKTIDPVKLSKEDLIGLSISLGMHAERTQRERQEERERLLAPVAVTGGHAHARPTSPASPGDLQEGVRAVLDVEAHRPIHDFNSVLLVDPPSCGPFLMSRPIHETDQRGRGGGRALAQARRSPS